MSVLDVELVPEVAGLLKEIGQTAKYVATPLKRYDVATGKMLSAEGTETPVIVSPPQQFSRMFDGDVVRIDDLKVYSMPDVIPSVGNQLKVGLDRFNIVAVYPLYTGEKIAAYKLQLRR